MNFDARFRSFLFLFLAGLLAEMGFIPWALGQDEEVGSSYTSSDIYVPESSPFPQLRTLFGVQEFQNQTLRLSGYSYEGTVGLLDPEKYFLYASVPFLYGQLRGREEQEMGNPKFGVEGHLFQVSSIAFWGEASAKVSRPGSKMAARYDTYRAGASLRFDRNTFFSRMAAGQNFRTNEQDTHVDVGDFTDFEVMVGKRFFHRWTGFGKLMYYKSQGVKFNDLVIARDTEWAGVEPGIRYTFASGFDLGLGAIFPVLQSRSVQETEVSLWEIGFPRVSEITLVSELGVQF